MRKTNLINIKIDKNVDFTYIGRGTPFGNANTHLDGSMTREQACDAYEYDFNKEIKTNVIFKLQVLNLYGDNLGCSCVPFQRCHGQTIQNYLNNIVDFDTEFNKTLLLFKKIHPNTNLNSILKK